jgi:diketogulonate reductase-like aldo/keto reductase
MEKVYLSGKVRAIGMANYRIRHFEKLFKEGVEIMPHCVQFELHPLRTANDIVSYCRERNIAIQAYSPLCRMIPRISSSKILNEIAVAHHKTIAQTILRWHIQNHTVPVFKSLNPHRLKENFDIFDFELSNTEMHQIASLNEDYKYHIESASCPGY